MREKRNFLFRNAFSSHLKNDVFLDSEFFHPKYALVGIKMSIPHIELQISPLTIQLFDI